MYFLLLSHTALRKNFRGIVLGQYVCGLNRLARKSSCTACGIFQISCPVVWVGGGGAGGGRHGVPRFLILTVQKKNWKGRGGWGG
jgi:hypothetical protein